MSLDGFNARALLNELLPQIVDSRLQKFSQLTEDAFLLHFRAPRQTHKLIISLHQERSRFHLLSGRHPSAIVPNSFVMLCRKHIGGTRLQEIRQPGLDRKIEFCFHSGFSLIFDWAGRPSGILLCESETRLIIGTYPSRGRHRLRSQYLLREEDVVSCLERTSTTAWTKFSCAESTSHPKEALALTGDDWAPLWKKRFAKMLFAKEVSEVSQEQFEDSWNTFFSPLTGPIDELRPGLASDGELTYLGGTDSFESLHSAAQQRWKDSSLAPGVADFRQELLKRLKKLRDKSERKLKKREQDRRGAESAPVDQMKGDLLLAYAVGLKKGSVLFETQDWNGKPLAITLDPKLSATDNAERYYNKSKKKKRALAVLGEQIEAAKQEIEMWEELIYAAQSSDDRTDLEQVRQSVPSTQKGQKGKKVPQTPSSGPRRFQHGGFVILVGRNPVQNEKLSLRTAAKDDHWFHVRQGAGSHVLLRAAGMEPPPATVASAAWLAAKYSQAASSPAVEVITTRARFLKKIKGGPAGKVTYRQEYEILVDPTTTAPEGLDDLNKNGFPE